MNSYRAWHMIIEVLTKYILSRLSEGCGHDCMARFDSELREPRWFASETKS